MIRATTHRVGFVARRRRIGALVAALALVAAFGSVNVVSAARSTDASLSIANGVFAGTTTATIRSSSSQQLWVKASCFQGGVRVYTQWRMFDSNFQAVLNLGPTQLWQSGAADCTGWGGYFAKNGTFRVLATTTFDVSA